VPQGDSERARTYFEGLAPEYDRAFRLEGRGALDRLVNRFFRGPTFAIRMRRLESLFAQIGLRDKSVLDLGCGSGQVSLLAASMGGRVHAIDIAPRMLAIAREAAARSGLAERVRFEEGDVAGETALPPADLTLLIGVLEYHRDHAALVRKAAAATREVLILAHTNRVPYRMALRKLMFRLQGAGLYFHRLSDVVTEAEAAGLRLRRGIREHAFTILVFDRR
jgi:2-polyprenyl-3-methyl-5-hydroxy-6-metoxy-1,4-benzoquinol methylase